MSITALTSQVQPVTNKRNSALIAKAMEDSLGVAPNRGVINFVPIAEENLSTNGKTVAGEIDDLEKETAEETSITRGLSVRVGSKSSRRQSMKELKKKRSAAQLPTHDEQLTPPLSACETNPKSPPLPKMPAVPNEKSFTDRKAEKVQKMGRRKSFISTIFGK